MRFYIYRNTTLENVFGNKEFAYSDYSSISIPVGQFDAFLWFYIVSVEKSRSSLMTEIDAFSENIRFLLSKTAQTTPFYALTLYNFNRVDIEMTDYVVQEKINSFNSWLFRLMSDYPNLHVLDIDDFVRNYRSNELIDWKYYFSSGIVINPRLSINLKDWFWSKLSILGVVRKKCLVLDLDNTLWYGILGEESARVGGVYPGNAYAYFQSKLHELAQTGIILALCSKNNEQDVWKFWNENPQMILKKDDIAAYAINWDNKVDNIRLLSSQLNIGLDSMVFIDDNPSERELVKGLLPEVEVPDFPERPYALPDFSNQLIRKYFTTYRVTEEDLNKTEQYKTNALRSGAVAQFSTLTDYYNSLQLEVTIRKANKYTIARAAQLTQKTNQFNLTTRRYTEVEIWGFLNNGSDVYCMSVKDKFGDDGITGLVIVEYENEKVALIDTFLLSCRILGKEIEYALLGYLLDQLKEKGIEIVNSEFVPEARNTQVYDFYEKAGFTLIEEKNAIKKYEMILSEGEIKKVNHIKIMEL
ncbi:MAG: hypothetical protein RIS29_519 [Bacteroidota bacterium]|jgi:FkbH-like protein